MTALKFAPETIETVAVSELKPYERNPRTHSDDQVGKIAASMMEFGWTVPIMIDDENEIIAGHGRVMAAQRLGVQSVPAIRLRHLTPEQIAALRIADNQITILGDWDMPLLSAETQNLGNLGFDLDILGFDNALLSRLLTTNGDGLTDPDDAPEITEHVVSQTGDLWLLDKHRMLCGDCTKDNDTSKLMDGKFANLTFTSPPYGISLEYEKDKTYSELVSLIEKAIYSIDRVSAKESYATVNYADVFMPGSSGFTCMTEHYFGPFTHLGWHLRGNRVWAKPFARLSLSYGTSTTMNLREWEYIQTFRKGSGMERLREHGMTLRGVWKSYGDDAIIRDWRQFDDTTSKSIHQAAFPVLLPIAGIRCYTDENAVIFEPFSGSGTTIIAAQITGRACFACEIAPQYVDVAVRRWQDFTGLAATLDGDGRTFDQIAEERA